MKVLSSLGETDAEAAGRPRGARDGWLPRHWPRHRRVLRGTGLLGHRGRYCGGHDRRGASRRYAAHVTDVTDEEQIDHAIAEADRRFGRLDIVVANAGVVPPWHETEELDLDEWDRVFAVNARGVAATIKHAVPFMMARRGAIVVTASVNVLKAHARQLAYTATKHAPLGIIRCAALDLGRFNIRVNGIAPGPVATEAMRERMRYRSEEHTSELQSHS